MVFYGILGLYALERFGYGTDRVGLIFTVLGVVTVLGQGVLVGPLTKRFGDPQVIRWGFLASGLGLLSIPLAGSFPALLLLIGLFSAWTSVLIPSITSLTSKRSTISQGAAMGLSNSFVSLGRIFGPMIGGLVFDLNLNLPFVVGGLIMGIGMFIYPEKEEAV